MSTARREERLVGGRAGRLLVAASLGWTSIQAGRLVLAPLLPAIVADLGIDSFRAGVALSLLWGLYALSQYPSGRLSDRLSRRTLLVAALSLLAAGFALLAAAPTYPAFLAGAAVVGLGAGFYPTAARALISDLYVARRGRAFGLHTASGDVGGALAAGLAVAALAVATWRAALVPVVAAVAVVAVSLHRWSDEPYDVRRVPLSAGDTARRLFGRPRIRWLLAAYSLYAFAWQSAVSFLPTYLQAGKGFSAALSGGGFAVLFFVGAAVKPAAGSLGDRFARPRVAAAALGVAAASLAFVLVAGPALLVLAGVVGFAAGLMAFPPVMQAYLMDTFADETMGGDLGAMRTVYIGVGAAGPTYVGFVGGTAGYGVAFAGLLVCLLVSGGVILALSRS